ncbi:MAG: BMP family ABC transporter substrate-binding protein [Desulfovibrionales bacterium]|nr:MAG: BMP family ABC transporter substrate-binding protein [Desulfovibrionales bacterium]
MKRGVLSMLVAGLAVLALMMVPVAVAAKEIKAGFIYVSPVGDAGWSRAHDDGRRAIEALDGVETTFVESVSEGPDSERVLLNMARRGHNLIFATSFGFMDSVIKVAAQFPDVVFMHCSGYKLAENVGTYFGRMYQPRYLSGMVAGAMTESNILGYVAAFPIPEVIRGINAFTLGAQAVNPDVQVRVVWSSTWYDPALEKEAANSLLDVGADVIAMHQDSPGPQVAAQERGVYSIGYNTDMSAFAPDAHLTAPIWNWSVVYKDVVQQVKDGTWASESIWWGLDRELVGLAPFGPMVPQDIQEAVLAKKEEIRSGETDVFIGPVLDQQGEVRIPEGVRATDEEMLAMDWFVQGVVGATR